MSQYITKDYIDFTQDDALKSTIAVRTDREDDEETIFPLCKTDLFFRVAKIDNELYFYLSKDEINNDVIKDEVERLSVSPL